MVDTKNEKSGKNTKNSKKQNDFDKVHESCNLPHHSHCDCGCDCDGDSKSGSKSDCGGTCDHSSLDSDNEQISFPSCLDYSSLTEEYLDALADLMNKKYESVLTDGRSFSISTDYAYDILKVSVILANSDRSYYYPVEARIQHKQEELSCFEAAEFLINFIDLYFEEYLFEDDNLFIPIDWTPFSYDAIDFQIRGQILNLKLEAQADSLIQNASKEEKEEKEDKKK